jgi:peptide/nickel transport system ATP-binding protein
VSTPYLLAVENLSIRIRTAHAMQVVVSEASFAVARGETLGIVGESGSGKSLSMLSLLQLLPDSAQAQAARASFEDRPLLQLSRRELESVRGRQIAFVFQDPLAALNPLRTVGAQIGEVAQRHFGLNRAQSERRAAELLAQVGIADALERLRHYPHEFSGGQRQRITIAMALAGEPQLLIADEPTTALDVTVQAEIVNLIKTMQRDRHMTVIWVTHDLALLARLADRVIVMYRGQVVEQAGIAELFRAPQHPHTRELVASLRLREPAAPGPAAPAPPVLLAARGLGVRYQRGGRSLQALADVDLSIHEGETLAVVGESGSGKSTLARALIGLIAPFEGSISVRGVSLDARTARVPRAVRRQLQMVFQDPFSSLNPRRTVGAAIAEPLIVHRLARGAQLKRRVAECLTLVGLDPAVAPRYPHEFSGGQRQRICIARAIACEPSLIVADEALSALDLTLQAQMLALFAELKQRCALTYLFISHDLSTVERISDRVAVLYLGRIIELAATAALYAHARHPYTRALLAAVPVADPEYERSHPYQPLAGEPPSAANPPPGCAFHHRCPRAQSRCRTERPTLTELAPGHAVACHYPH